MIVATSLLCAVIAGVGAVIIGKKYTATVLLSVVSDDHSAMGGISSLLGQFSTLSNIAGISLSSDSKKSESVATLQSRSLTEQFISDHQLVPVLFKDNLFSFASEGGKGQQPSLWKASELFNRYREVTVDAKTGLVSLSITWRDPELAAQWANQLVELANRRLRDRAIQEAERNIAYLSEQSRKADLVALQSALSDIMGAQLKQAMLARGNEEYALRVIDPAFPPENPSTPRKIFVILAGLLVGFGTSVLIARFRQSNRALG